MKKVVKAEDAQEELVAHFQERLEQDDDWQQAVIDRAIGKAVESYEQQLEDDSFILGEWSAGRGEWSINEDGDLAQEEE